MNCLATKSEIEKWIENAKRKRTGYLRVVDDCDKQLARLEPVYKELGDIKRSFRSIRKSTVEIICEKKKWCGEKYSSFCQDGDALDTICGEYYKTLDVAQDSINVKIGELKAKKRELLPLIGGLWGQIERWKVDIQNIGN